MIVRVTTIVAFVLFTSLCRKSYAQNYQVPNNPCPDVFQYSQSGNKNIGIISIKSVAFGQTTVEIQLSQPGNLYSDYPGQLSLNFNKDKILEYVSSGRLITCRVDFPQQNVIPQVTSISVNGLQICSGPKANPPSSSMKLDYTLKTSPGSSGIPQYQRRTKRYIRNPSWPDFHSQYQPNFSQRQVHQPSFATPTHNQQSFNQQSFNQPSFNPQTGSEYVNNFIRTLNQNNINQPAYTQSTFNQPAFNQQPINQQRFNQLSAEQETLGFMAALNRRQPNQSISQENFNPTSFNQPTVNYGVNPKNPFLNRGNSGNNYQPLDGYGPLNVPPTYGPPKTPKPTQPQFIYPAPVDDFHTRYDPKPIQQAVTQSPAKSPTNRASLEYINSVCGQENPNVDHTRLNINGQIIAKSRFPWIVAILRRTENILKFHCGGSLISTKSVVSAAHCFFLGLAVLPEQDIIVSVGRHNLTDDVEAHNMEVETVISHPEYKPNLVSFDADIAIVRLKESVLFTFAIRPICMWQGPSDLRNIENVPGIIVGWGADGHSNSTIVPTLVATTVVSWAQCLRSNPSFFSTTSNRTLCAGNENRNSGPCIGDSGNGLMIRKYNKWMLRGSVSASLGTPNGHCNVEEYAIYADAAMFSDWIRSNMWL